jgi:hypothetical protein
MKKAVYEILNDDNSYYRAISGFDGVISNAGNLEECRKQL